MAVSVKKKLYIAVLKKRKKKHILCKKLLAIVEEKF